MINDFLKTNNKKTFFSIFFILIVIFFNLLSYNILIELIK